MVGETPQIEREVGIHPRCQSIYGGVLLQTREAKCNTVRQQNTMTKRNRSGQCEQTLRAGTYFNSGNLSYQMHNGIELEKLTGSILGRDRMTSEFGAHLIGNLKISKVRDLMESNDMRGQMTSVNRKRMGIGNEGKKWKVTGLTNGNDCTK